MLVGEAERPQAEALGKPDTARVPFLSVGGNRGPCAVKLLGAARARKRLERMHAEALRVGIEGAERCGAAHVCHPRAGRKSGRHLMNGGVGHAEEHELSRWLPDGNPPLLEPGGPSRANPPSANDIHACEHLRPDLFASYTGGMNLRVLCKSKIHHAVVTKADLHYVGSIGIDASLMRLADLVPGEQVAVWNMNNGQRIETYALALPEGSGEIVVNGAAARHFHRGDQIIIVAFALTDELITPRMIAVDERNRFVRNLSADTAPEDLLPAELVKR
jgi:aspartate 1-decarboxylase